MGGAGRRRLGRLHREAGRAPTHGGASHIVVRRPRRRRPLGPAVPDVGHDLAGLQPLRRQQPLHRRARPGRAYKVSYNRPFTTRRRSTSTLDLQRRVPDGALAGAQRLRRQLHAPASTPTARRELIHEPQGVPLGRPRRVLVGRPARQRRERARDAGVQPRVLQRQRDVLEDALGDEHRRHRHAVPHAGHLQGDARQRRRSTRSRELDRHLARSALQPAGRRRPARERADRHDLHGQRLPATTRSRCPPSTGRCGSGATPSVAALPLGARTAHARGDASATSGTSDLDNGFRPAGLVRLSSTTVDGRRRSCTTTATPTAPGTATHSLTLYRARERRARLRRRHGAVVLGPRRRTTTASRRDRRPTTAHAAGDGEPVRRHGRAAGDAAGGPRRRRPRRPTRRAPTVDDHLAGRRRARSAGSAGDDHRHRDGHRRRGSAASKCRPTAARPGIRANGHGELDLRLDAARRSAPTTIRSRAVDDSGNLGTAGDQVRPSTVDLPVQPLEPGRRRSPDGRRGRHERRRARRQVPRRRRTATITGVRFYKGTRQHRHAHRQPLDGAGTLLGSATFTGETASGWQEVTSRAGRGRRPTRPTSPRTTRRTGHYAVEQRLLRHAGVDTAPLHAPARRRRRRQRRLHLRRGSGFPTELQRHQLLGRRRLHDRQRRATRRRRR